MQPQETPRSKAVIIWGIVLILLLLAGWWVWAILPGRVEHYAQQVLDQQVSPGKPLLVLDGGTLSLENGDDVATVDLEEYMREVAREIVANAESEEEPTLPPSTTSSSTTTVVQNPVQTLSLSGNILAISNGNEVVLPDTEATDVKMGALDGQPKTASGAAIVDNTLYLQSASASYPGVMTIGAQTLAGDKTFQNNVMASGIGVNVSSPTNGIVDIVIDDPADVGLHIMGAAGQAGDMMVFANENYDRVTYINEMGELRVISGAPNTVAVRIKQRSGSQTGDLTQWADNSNNVFSVVDADGNFGIGVANPGNTLEVNGGLAGLSGLRFTQLNSSSTAGGSNGKVLTVDANGDIILVNDATSTTTNSITLNGTNGNGNASRWTNMPAALTEIFANVTGVNSPSSRVQYDLTNASEARFMVNVNTVGAATSQLRLQYSTDQISWNYLDGGTGYALGVNTQGLKVSSWGAITAGALGDVYLRIVGINGDELADPEFGLIQLQVR